MATYKVIQDIEAEDKLVGPFTLRQFMYAGIVAILGFVTFKLAPVNKFLVIPFLPTMVFFGMLSLPFGHDQPTEVWLLAKVRFFLIPRKRIWDQSGIKELVTITVPKKIEKYLTDGLSQTEVKSRLQALANTIDSRGWSVKNVNVNMFSQPSYLANTQTDSDRLIDTSTLPQDVPDFEVLPADDMLDATNNPTAQHLDSMITQSEQAHRQNLVAKMQGKKQPASDKQAPADYWFMNQPEPGKIPDGSAVFSHNPVVVPGTKTNDTFLNENEKPSDTEAKLLDKIHREKAKPNPAYGHMKVLDPGDAHKTKRKSSKHPEPEAENPNKYNIARLAGNDDLNISTIAREANKQDQKSSDDEVIINLRNQ